MKIAIVTVGSLPVPSVRGGGAETLIEQILEENENRGDIKFKVYSIKNEQAEQKSKNFKKTQFMFLPQVKNPVFKRLKRKWTKIVTGFDIPIEIYSYQSIIKDIESENFDFILIENTMVPFLKYAKKFEKKVLIHTHWDYINNNIPEMVLKEYRKAAIKAGGIITVSEYIKKQILTVPEIDEKNIYVLKNCTDLNRFQIDFSKEDKDLYRSKYGLGNDEIVMVFTGRISEEKGVLQLVRAFKTMKNKDNIKLVIVGSAKTGDTIVDEYTQKVYDEIEDIKDSVVFTGYVEYEDMPKIYHMADIAVLPSTGQDPAPLTIFEAMASGLPIITTYSGGIPEYASDECALFCKIDNDIETNLKKNMEQLTVNKEKRMLMGNNSYERAKLFSTENYYRDFVSIVNQISGKEQI